MDLIIVDGGRVDYALDELAARLHVSPEAPDYQELARLVAGAAEIARPRACYRLAYIEAKNEDGVVVDGVSLTSRVLRVNLEAVDRVFVQVATCGVELDRWVHALDDLLWEFWGEAIKEVALRQALTAVRADQDERFHPARSSTMSPGSLPDWPLPQQRPLFAILGDVEGTIGVHLTPSMLMVPNKSTSAVRFETETDFASCLLCPREGCPNRRAVYDPDLYARRFASVRS